MGVVFPQLLQELRESTLSAARAVLTSMITPALLLSATGTFIISTSARLGRCMDRVRALSFDMEKLLNEEHPASLQAERQSMMAAQVALQSKRAQLLQRCLRVLYIASGVFVATSVAIGAASIAFSNFSWAPLVLGILGACFLFYATVLLISETALSGASLDSEIEFFNKLAAHLLSDSKDNVNRPRPSIK